MFEIRIICDPNDTDRVTTALAGAFTTGSVREHPTRDGQRTRLYVTADHRPTADDWPTPDQAYAKAPSIISEIGWTANAAIGRPTFALLDREFWLRKAALLDRIALGDDAAPAQSDANEAADQAAQRLLEVDGVTDVCGPRGYVRRQYATWIENHL
ncbi:hypothetical protein ACGF1Z_17915 [Streptomyces sp. NPDC048018]|uniref:hypothetical protein n=1 Tax=Streptomyces sp. NPDC048018 TaxID=3365499 RepID=UPI0037132D6A